MMLTVESDGGRIAVEVEGDGPLLLCIPGMGDLRSEYRHLTPSLVEAGYRVATMDLRGHGDSSLEFDAYDDEAAARDALAVIAELGGSAAAILGNSMGAAAAALAAAQQPESAERLVLIGPFVRDHGSAATRLILRLVLARPWGPAAWRRYFRSLFPSGGPVDRAEHEDAVMESLRRPGRWRAFQRTTRTSHAFAEAALPAMSIPVLVVMGEQDRDFPDPRAEAAWIAGQVGGQAEMIAEAGHYPMAERAEPTLAAILPFLREGEIDG